MCLMHHTHFVLVCEIVCSVGCDPGKRKDDKAKGKAESKGQKIEARATADAKVKSQASAQWWPEPPPPAVSPPVVSQDLIMDHRPRQQADRKRQSSTLDGAISLRKPRLQNEPPLLHASVMQVKQEPPP